MNAIELILKKTRKRNVKFIKYEMLDKLLCKHKTFDEFYKNTYGFGVFFKKIILKRFETCTLRNIHLKKNFKFGLLKTARVVLNRVYNFKDLTLRNILFMYKVKNYKSYRHLRGFPTRGQRTWSNGNTAFYKNTILRNFLYHRMKYVYNGVTASTANTSFLAEYCNSL